MKLSDQPPRASHRRSVAGRNPAHRAARGAGPGRHQVRLWHRFVRRLHRVGRRPGAACLPAAGARAGRARDPHRRRPGRQQPRPRPAAGLAGRERAAMRLLPGRAADGLCRAAVRGARPQRCADRRGAGRQPVPMRHAQRASAAPCGALRVGLRHEAAHAAAGGRWRPGGELCHRLRTARHPGAAVAAAARCAVLGALCRRPLRAVHPAGRDGPAHRHRAEAGGLRRTRRALVGAGRAPARHRRHPPGARHRRQRFGQGLRAAAGPGLCHVARCAGRRAQRRAARSTAAAVVRAARLWCTGAVRRPARAAGAGCGTGQRPAAVRRRPAPARHALRPRAARAGVARAGVRAAVGR